MLYIKMKLFYLGSPLLFPGFPTSSATHDLGISQTIATSPTGTAPGTLPACTLRKRVDLSAYPSAFAASAMVVYFDMSMPAFIQQSGHKIKCKVSAHASFKARVRSASRNRLPLRLQHTTGEAGLVRAKWAAQRARLLDSALTGTGGVNLWMDENRTASVAHIFLLSKL